MARPPSPLRDIPPSATPEPPPEPRKPGRGPWRLLILLLILGGAVAGTIAFGDRLGFETLRDNRETVLAFRDANYLLTALAFMGAYVAIVVFALPGALVASLTGGFLFGLFPGALFNLIAATFGSVLIFLAVRWGLGAKLAAKMEADEGRLRQFKLALDENAFSALLTVRLIPVIPFFVTNIAAALMGMRLAPFVAATAIGVIPGGVIYTWVGAGLGEVFELGETPDLGILFEWHVLGPLIGLAALAALPMLMRRLRRSEYRSPGR